MSNATTKLTESEESFNKRKQVAISVGFEYLGRLTNSETTKEKHLKDYGLYRKISCGHVLTLNHKNVSRLKTDYCKICTENKYRDFVELSGMEFICFSRKKTNGTLYVDVNLPCGHFKSIQTGNLLKGTYSCRVCLENKYKKVCESFGFKYIRHVSNAKHEVELPCGCRDIRHIGNILIGYWTCNIHNISHLDRESNIYLIKMKANDGNSWLKLGYANNLSERFNGYGFSGDVEPIKIVSTENARIALTIEKQLHTKFRKYSYDKELMICYMTSGFTECYPLNMLQILMNELDAVEKEFNID